MTYPNPPSGHPATWTGQQLLHLFRDFGVSDRDVAQQAEASPAALARWRRGSPMVLGARRRLVPFAQLILDLLEEGVNDPVGLLETNVGSDIHLTAMQVLHLGHPEQAKALCRALTQGTPVEHILDQVDTHWRDKYVDQTFEVVTGSDGLPSIQPRQPGTAL